MKKTTKFVITFILICVTYVTFFSYKALAYYNRGKVTLTLGTNNVNVAKGSCVTVTAVMNPASRTGLPGCGSATCPQGCGGQCGDEVNGECPCAGDTQITKQAIAAVETSNAVIATASYSQNTGLITINGLNPGTVQIKVTGTLWQYTDSDSQIINVTVNNSANQSTTASNSTNPSPTSSSGNTANISRSSGSSSTTVNTNTNQGVSASQNPANNTVSSSAANTTSGNTAAASNNSAANTAGTSCSTNSQSGNSSYSMKGTQGEMDIITLGTAKTGKSEFEKIKGQNKKVTFQKNDSSNNVLYSWIFNGKDIENPMDINMTINTLDISSAEASITRNLESPLYLYFVHSGKLPGKATIFMNVGSHYKNGTSLSLYYYNKNKSDLELIASNLKVSGGYVSFKINHCSEYFLAEGMHQKNNAAFWIIILIVILLLLTVIISFIIIRKKKMS